MARTRHEIKLPRQRKVHARPVLRHRMELESGSLNEINKMRQFLGMTLLTFKDRVCLRCKKTFVAFGRGNHMCSNCEGNEDVIY